MNIFLKFLKYLLVIFLILIILTLLTNLIFVSTSLPYFEKQTFTNNIKNIFSDECTKLCSSENCLNYCLNFTNETDVCISICKNTTLCINSCNEQIQKLNSVLEEKINEMYENKIVWNYSLNEFIEIEKNSVVPSIIILIISVIVLFFILENPLSFIGKQIIFLGLGLVSLKYIFEFIINKFLSFSNAPEIIISKLLEYFMKPISDLFLYGIIFIIFGIGLIIIQRFLKR
ncbi:MAG: hypothetical protein QXY29_03225 [Candidatus Aenigmatarchaeota archaeon]